MFKRFENGLKVFLSFHKSEQRGILVLLILLLLILLLNIGLPFLVPDRHVVSDQLKKEIAPFLATRKQLEDSLKFVRLQASGNLDSALAKRFIHPLRFDPNRVDAETLKQMGLNAKQIKNLLRYRKHGGIFNKPEDLLKVYGISEVEFHILQAFVKIGTVSKSKKQVTHRHASLAALKKVEINSCSVNELETKVHIPEWLAQRMIKYRQLLGGFYSVQQLSEVYGMKPETLKKIMPFIELDTQKIHQIDLEHAQFKTILHHPYFDYKSTKKLMDYRYNKHTISSLDSAALSHLFTDSLWRKIHHYLYLRPLKK
jgi:DNA uptake protein ComE-like DNA-binding protein